MAKLSIQNNLALIILAAGESKRMGQPKQLLPWNGTTLLGHCIQQATQCYIKDVFVVLGAHYKTIYETHKTFNVTFLNNTSEFKGLSASIAFGVQHISKFNYDGVLFVLADQPQLTSMHLNKMIELYHNTSNIITTTYPNKKSGVPVLFGAKYFNDLILNTSVKGAQTIIKQYKNAVASLQPMQPLEDIDTPEDYKLLYSRFHR